jgi:hypothetical protein
MHNKSKKLQLNTTRRFGVEIELNSFDLRNRPSEGKQPEGIHQVGLLVHRASHRNVTIHKYANDHYNENWVIKPDGSCGLEVCSPVLKGVGGLDEVASVIQAFRNDKRIYADERCSLHIHVDLSDLSISEVATVLTWWIKCEAVFMDAMPSSRKMNHYCQALGFTSLFDNIEQGFWTVEHLIKTLGKCKYYSVNTYHYNLKNRKTIEFRIMDNSACQNKNDALNWVSLLLHFIERSLCIGFPKDYVPYDCLSGYCWLDPFDVFDFLGFIEIKTLSPELKVTRLWFLERLLKYTGSQKTGVFSRKARKIAIQQLKKLRIDVNHK